MTRYYFFSPMVLAVVISVGPLLAPEALGQTPSPAEIDNASQQPNNLSDVEIARQIRKNLVQNSTLSTAAKNIKVIAVEGNVSLKGSVNTQLEKNEIERIAKSVTGVNTVTNELSVVK